MNRVSPKKSNYHLLEKKMFETFLDPALIQLVGPQISNQRAKNRETVEWMTEYQRAVRMSAQQH